MAIGWSDIAFIPDDGPAASNAEAWEWLIGDRNWQPVICSKLGDLFFERAEGGVYWLSCSAGSLEFAAVDRAAFDEICRNGGPEVSEWFGPSLIESLHEAGKIAGEGQCYLFITLPIFEECRYEPDNLAVVPSHEVFAGLANIHRQIADLPDGSNVQIKVID